jgi:hypothetical protein
VSARLFWKALGVQAAAVALLFATLVALPLGESFFEDWGPLVGPAAWLGCSLLAARLLALPVTFVLFAAIAGGVAGAIVLVAASHLAGMIVALLIFGASCAGYDPTGDRPATTE